MANEYVPAWSDLILGETMEMEDSTEIDAKQELLEEFERRKKVEYWILLAGEYTARPDILVAWALYKLKNVFINSSAWINDLC